MALAWEAAQTPACHALTLDLKVVLCHSGLPRTLKAPSRWEDWEFHLQEGLEDSKTQASRGSGAEQEAGMA